MVKPSECNAKRELPLTTLVSQLIDLATDHANLLGIGFLFLEPKGLGWVLSRLSVEMREWPKCGDLYIISTWIESYNSHFSERCFSVKDKNGNSLGFARTIWMIIDLSSHKSMGTADTIIPQDMIPTFDCPIPKMARNRSFSPDKITEYIFKYTDLDFYRHVNTVKYISLLLNQFSLEDFDTHVLSRFDIAFFHEAKYGETAIIKSMEESTCTPGLLVGNFSSFKKTFEISVGETQVLYSSIVLSREH